MSKDEHNFYCPHTKASCHHDGYKCSECPVTDLICDEFYACVDAAYEQGKKELEEYLKAYCLKGAAVAEECAEKCLKVHGNGQELAAFAYFDQRHTLFRYELPGIIDDVLKMFEKGECIDAL